MSTHNQDKIDENLYYKEGIDSNQPDNPNAIQAKPPAELVENQDYVLSEYLGGQDSTLLAAFLPERLDWDKKSGYWVSESFGVGLWGFTGKLVGATTAWAIWSDKLGKPEHLSFGPRPQDDRAYEMGWRLVIEIDDALFYWDAFGLCVKPAQSACRRAQKFQGWFEFDGFKVVPTNFGEFKTPKLTTLNEASA